MSISRTHMLESVCFTRECAITVYHQWSSTALKLETSVSLIGLLLSTLVSKSSRARLYTQQASSKNSTVKFTFLGGGRFILRRK